MKRVSLVATGVVGIIGAIGLYGFEDPRIAPLLLAAALLAPAAVLLGTLASPWAAGALSTGPRMAEQPDDPWLAVEQELERSRRHRRSFALVRISGTGEDVRPAVASRLRRIDRIWWSGGHLFVLLPECGHRAADAFVARLLGMHPHFSGTARVNVAAFPEDALTSGALLAALDVASAPIPLQPVATYVATVPADAASEPPIAAERLG